LSSFCLGAFAQTRGIALAGGTLIDGSGGEPVRNSVVLIRNDKIERVGTVGTLPIPEGYERISTEGMTVLPGLWDLHVHLIYGGHPDLFYWLRTYESEFEDLTMPAAAQQMLNAGVTSARDLAAPTSAVLAIKERVESGELPGPTIYTSGSGLLPGETGPALPHAALFSGAADAARKTRELAEAGVDVIKIFGAEGRPVDEIRAVVETAHSLGLQVTAHGRTDAEIRVGLAAGVDEFQHIGTDTAELPPDIVEAIRRRIESGTPLYWSPTIGAEANKLKLARDFEYLESPRNFAGLPPRLAQDVRASLDALGPSPLPANLMRTLKRKVEQLQELGVTLVSGSDEGTFGQPAGDALWRDLDAWIRDFGLQPMAAIKWVTADAAAYMGAAEQVGTIHEGKYADVIAVEGNPLEYISVLRDPAVVLKRGQRIR
jgi:imidazolonepropionase-like amidohydrolase